VIPTYVRKVLDISIAHIKPETEAELEDMGEQLTLILEPTSYGWMIYINSEGELPTEIVEDYPDLAACLKLAQHYGCDWLMFDRDGTVIDELPEYEW